MLEFYPHIKSVHVVTALASGSLFALRGVLVQFGIGWAMAAPIRYLSYAIDSVLLSAALLLVAILPGTVFANGWLAVKIVLLIVYILLGTFALKRGRTGRVRLLCFVAALVVFASLYAVARSHDPLGPWILLQQAAR